MPTALISGITGQDGSYLAELLLGKGYCVHGIVRRCSLPNTARLSGILDKLTLHQADMTDANALAGVVRDCHPDEVYNLAALSDVKVSFAAPVYCAEATGLGCTRLLEVLRQEAPQARFYQAGSSEMYGMNPDVPTDEGSEFMPGSPYAAAKVYAYHMTRVYRESYGMFAVSGILFNHESPRRGVEFVTRKITLALARILRDHTDSLVLGNLDAKRDWGFAGDYVEAMHRMLRSEEPGDYVIATGETHSVREFLDIAFGHVNLDWHQYVRTDERYLRPMDPPVLLGDASDARRELGWEPQVAFPDLVRMMVDADLEAP